MFGKSKQLTIGLVCMAIMLCSGAFHESACAQEAGKRGKGNQRSSSRWRLPKEQREQLRQLREHDPQRFKELMRRASKKRNELLQELKRSDPQAYRILAHDISGSSDKERISKEAISWIS